MLLSLMVSYKIFRSQGRAEVTAPASAAASSAFEPLKREILDA
jgi:hypothetical protein